jgi:UDP-N-acetylmuramyl pentapeptide phosphotransferase/UDP-N-acetylglucosamine-1-phosphate transferase
MGDSGSLIIGAILSVLAMKVIDHPTHKLPMWLESVPTPLFAMAVIAYPLVDTFRVFVVRASKGVSPFSADRNHIHHRLLDHGFGHRGTTFSLYLYALTIIGLSLLTRDLHPNKGLMVLGVTAIVLAMLPFALPVKGKKR